MKHLAYNEVAAQEMKGEGVKDVTMRLLIGPQDGAANFAMRRFTVRPGGHTPLHTHDWEHEVYVLAGAGESLSDAGPRPMKPGDFLYIPPNEKHQFKNIGPTDLEFICLIPSKYQQ
jgi:quercetin dioxygenase-like cupin family protein